MFKQALTRNIWLYLALALLLAQSADWNKCLVQRGKYLLGIVYNGHFQNARDGLVYQDYLKSHGITHEFIKAHID